MLRELAGGSARRSKVRWYKSLLLVLITPWWLSAAEANLGEEPFTLGLALDAYALGEIYALSFSQVSLGSNAAALQARPLKLAWQHTSGFGAAYLTDGLFVSKGRWNLALFRGAVSNIADTREALLDYGADGQPGTGDAGEGNGRLDPGERLDIHRVKRFGVSQLAVEVSRAFPRTRKLALGATIRLLLHDLYSATGIGVGFHFSALYQPLPSWRLGAELTDALTTVVFWNTGLTETYRPILYVGSDYYYRSKRTPFILRPVVQWQTELNSFKFSKTPAMGLEIGFKNQVFLFLGRNSQKSFRLGAAVRTRYFTLYYALQTNTLEGAGGNTQRIGLSFLEPKWPFGWKASSTD